MDIRKKQYDTQLAERLDQISQQHHLSGADLARIAGVGRSSVNGWKKRGTISKDSAMKISEATGISLSWILTGKDEGSDTLNDEEKALIATFRELPPAERQNMLAVFQMRLQRLNEIYSTCIDPNTRNK